MGRSKAVGSSSRKKIQKNDNLSFKIKTRVSLSSIILCALFALVSFYIVILSNVVRNHKLGSPLLDGGVTNGIDNSKSTPLGLQPYDNYNDKNIIEANNHLNDAAQKKSPSKQNSINLDRILTAYLEPNVVDFNKKPLPMREVNAHDLVKKSYPNVNSCSKLIEQFPVNNYPDDDPFLPWIHDVFPTHDGKWIQIVAQNKRRCKTGKSDKEKEIYLRLSAQVSLFQHVPVKRLDQSGSTTATATGSTTRYRLASHEDADDDGMQTRFICRFSNGEETLSVFNFSYEWASFRKKQLVMFHEDTSDNKQIHTSQLLFRCPVPKALVEKIRTGSSVKDDFATIFLDIVPIRTPVRYGAPNVFLPPYYKEFQDSKLAFDPAMEWGTNHTLPLIENSGRWANIPICKPTLLTYGNHIDKPAVLAPKESEEKAPVKMNRLVSCIWASAGYSTRGNRFAINDGQRRLLEWITYNKLIGIDHFYVYDNSGAFSNDVSLKFVADMFPNDVTLINWPSQVCNNNPNNVDSPGERSSQYAAESSCRLRFGDHTDWIAQVSETLVKGNTISIAPYSLSSKTSRHLIISFSLSFPPSLSLPHQFDIDEYLVPMGKSTSLRPLLDKLDSKGEKIISFGSWRAWPRRAFIE